MSEIDKYRFSKDITGLSAGNFKEFIKNRYKGISKDEIDGLVNKHYGSDKALDVVPEKTEKKEEADGNTSSGKKKAKSSS